ncbi:hypothetical protein MRX96_044642 [Rhipicephalus microplus]
MFRITRSGPLVFCYITFRGMFRGLCHSCCSNTFRGLRLGVYTRGTFRRTNSCIEIHLRSLALTVIDAVYVAVVGIMHKPRFLRPLGLCSRRKIPASSPDLFAVPVEEDFTFIEHLATISIFNLAFAEHLFVAVSMM